MIICFQSILLGVLYSPKSSDANVFAQLDLNIEAALNISKNVIIVGNINEDLLNDSKQYLKDVLLINSLHSRVYPEVRGQM